MIRCRVYSRELKKLAQLASKSSGDDQLITLHTRATGLHAQTMGDLAITCELSHDDDSPPANTGLWACVVYAPVLKKALNDADSRPFVSIDRGKGRGGGPWGRVLFIDAAELWAVDRAPLARPDNTQALKFVRYPLAQAIRRARNFASKEARPTLAQVVCRPTDTGVDVYGVDGYQMHRELVDCPLLPHTVQLPIEIAKKITAKDKSIAIDLASARLRIGELELTLGECPQFPPVDGFFDAGRKHPRATLPHEASALFRKQVAKLADTAYVVYVRIGPTTASVWECHKPGAPEGTYVVRKNRWESDAEHCETPLLPFARAVLVNVDRLHAALTQLEGELQLAIGDHQSDPFYLRTATQEHVLSPIIYTAPETPEDDEES